MAGGFIGGSVGVNSLREKRVSVIQRIDVNRYCWNRDHGEPCRLPCLWCDQECVQEDRDNSAVNRERTLQWEARHHTKEVGS